MEDNAEKSEDDTPIKKILIIRFSSIGDIVLTTPIIRCVKKKYPEAEIHYLTKQQNVAILQNNPYVDKIFALDAHASVFHSLIRELRTENYDFVVDLHKNLRSLRVILALKKPFASFPKLNFKKFLLVRFKKNLMPKVHIVDRYFKAVESLKVENDNKGLDYFLLEEDFIPNDALPLSFQNGYICIAVGSKHNTKQMPAEMIIRICQKINGQILLIGDLNDKPKANRIENAIGSRVFNACGSFSINQTAALIENSLGIITPDTGAMHIASALKKNIISVWGNTVKEFGMYPYLPKEVEERSLICEVEGLKCRPCSKLGYKKCPKKHFNCMRLQDIDKIVKRANSWFEDNSEY
ncbi:MAG: glycosyltransferase family 9 protein [Bacteroidota bacterium]|nr:glycosyltransferase family 9 protein [Bacteroidota bacterium]